MTTLCTGDYTCPAPVHWHGCYADLGRCESPGEHARHRGDYDERVDKTAHVREVLSEATYGSRLAYRHWRARHRKPGEPT